MVWDHNYLCLKGSCHVIVNNINPEKFLDYNILFVANGKHEFFVKTNCFSQACFLCFSTQVPAQHLWIIGEISNYFIDVWKLPFLVDMHCFLVMNLCAVVSANEALFLFTYDFSFYPQFPSLTFPLQCETGWPHEVQWTHMLLTFLVSFSLGWGEMNNNLPHQGIRPLFSVCIGQQKYLWYLVCINFIP